MARVTVEGVSTYGRAGEPGGREVEMQWNIEAGGHIERVHVFGYTHTEGSRKWTAYRQAGYSVFAHEPILDPVVYAPSLAALRRKLERVELTFNWERLDG